MSGPLLGVGQELVEGVLVVIQAGHGDQEALDDLPGLAAVVGLRVGTLQAVQSRLDRLQQEGRRAQCIENREGKRERESESLGHGRVYVTWPLMYRHG